MTKIKSNYDVIVLGNGPAGQACAIRSAELGMKVLLVTPYSDKALSNRPYPTHIENLGIMTLLESAKLYEMIADGINKHGIYVENTAVNFNEMVARKNQLIDDLEKSFHQTLKKLSIDYIEADAQLSSPGTIKINASLQTAHKSIASNNIVLAVDSVPVNLPFAPIDNEKILDSKAALNFKQIPKNVAILGAGIIGLQIAGIWNRLGANVIILEAQESFLNVTDYQVSGLAYQIFESQGLEIRLGTRVISTKIINDKVVVEYQDMDGIHAAKVDQLIVASGRRPGTENIAAPEADLLLDEDGFVLTNEEYRTNLPGVFAIGDLTMHGPMLSHKGIAEGNLLAERIAGQTGVSINYKTMPSIIYTEPEIAWVGLSEQNLRSIGANIKTATYPLENNLRAKAHGKTSGIVKIITNAKTDEILGIHILGSNASELIAEAALAIEFCASSEDLSRAIHSHPSLNEAFFEVGYSLK